MVADAAKRAHGVRERDARDDERGAEPERVGDEQDDAARDRAVELDASTRIDASTVPMHGAAHTANAPPSSAFEPRRRAPCRRLGATARSGHGRSPMNASPSTTSTNPAILSWVSLSTALPTAAAPAPRTTKTIVKPRMNGTLASAIRRPTPRSPSRSISTAEIADR